MSRFDFMTILRRAIGLLGRLLLIEPVAPSEGLSRRRLDAHPDAPPSPAERFIGLASFQDRLKNSRPPRIAFIRSISRSKCSGTSTKFRRSLFTTSSGLSE